MTSSATAAPGAANASVRPGRVLALVLLTAVGTTNFMDRQILSVLAEPIRQDLGLTDTQLGLLTGLAFAFFYAIMGVPAAMLADRTNRVRLVGLCCVVWSLFTGACAFAGSFLHLALARFGVGVGEAGGTAPSLSILADYYPPRMRPAIFGLFTANGPLGVFVGASFGGWAAAEYGWRTAFLLVAGVGAVAAALLLLLVREPARGGLDPVAAEHVKPQPLGATARVFISRPTLRWLVVSSALAAFVSTGMLAWIPAYLMRVQGMPLTEVAKWFGPAAGLCFGIGIAGGGALVNWASRRSLKAYAWIPGLSMLFTAPTLALALVAPDWQTALALLVVPMILSTIYVAPALALVQNLSPVAARATVTALLMLAFNIVGQGGGPLAIGLLSDLLAADGVADSLRVAMLGVTPVAVIAALCYLAQLRHVVGDAEAVVRDAA
ncbi:spinster family MFS transporter [Phenylobacterium sp. VNQ135]|uniref:spinster family MFS transporter n=1 Tax=Phenylobacterium sp. VNQ135 TaxID=3400922 RepID=UPI003C072EA9